MGNRKMSKLQEGDLICFKINIGEKYVWEKGYNLRRKGHALYEIESLNIICTKHVKQIRKTFSEEKERRLEGNVDFNILANTFNLFNVIGQVTNNMYLEMPSYIENRLENISTERRSLKYLEIYFKTSSRLQLDPIRRKYT